MNIKENKALVRFIIKKTIVFIFYLLSFSLAFSQTKDTIFGNVKSVREKLSFLDEKNKNTKLFASEGDYGHYGFSSIEFTKSRFYSWWFHTPYVHYLNYYKEFNKTGKPTYEVWLYQNGDTVGIYKYEYDKHHNLIKLTEGDNSTIITTDYVYDKSNKLTSSSEYMPYGISTYENVKYVYDPKSQLSRILTNIHLSNGDSFHRSESFTYDTSGRKKRHYKSCETKEAKGKQDDLKLIYRTDKIECLNREYFYNRTGKLIKTKYYQNKDQKVKLNRVTKSEYQGDIVKRTILEHGRHTSIREYDYDSNKRKTKEVHRSKRGVSSVTNYNYKDQGLLTMVKYVEPQKNRKTIIAFEYKFDKEGNWIEQTKSLNGTKLYVWTRKIEYY